MAEIRRNLLQGGEHKSAARYFRMRNLKRIGFYYLATIEQNIYVDGTRSPFFLPYPAEFFLNIKTGLE